MNKLSELSKPAWIVGEKEIADFMSGDEALLVRGHDPESTEPALRMYSQEYVTTLLAELEAKDHAHRVHAARLIDERGALRGRAEAAEKQLVYSRDAIATWERKAISNFEECAKLSQCIEELEKRLATPVRLPTASRGKFNAGLTRLAIKNAGFKFTVEGDE